MNLSFFNPSTSFADDICWVGHIRQGMVVQDTEFEDGTKTLIDRYGHITGFMRNITGELILAVLWQNSKEETVHPGNVMLLR